MRALPLSRNIKKLRALQVRVRDEKVKSYKSSRISLIMEVKLRKIFLGKETKSKLEFDKTSKGRPAWIALKRMPKDVQFIYVKINHYSPAYYMSWYKNVKIFLPIDPTPEEMRKYYDKFSKTYDKFVKQKNIKETAILLSRVKTLLPRKAKALDLGAGTGQSAVPFAKNGFDTTLVEVSEEMLNLARRRRGLRNCRFICKDVRRLNLKGEFDLIFSINSFACEPYFKEDEMPELYDRIAKHLKPNGLLAISGYDFEPPKNLLAEIDSGVCIFGKSRRKYLHKYFIGRKRKT